MYVCVCQILLFFTQVVFANCVYIWLYVCMFFTYAKIRMCEVLCFNAYNVCMCSAMHCTKYSSVEMYVAYYVCMFCGHYFL